MLAHITAVAGAGVGSEVLGVAGAGAVDDCEQSPRWSSVFGLV